MEVRAGKGRGNELYGRYTSRIREGDSKRSERKWGLEEQKNEFLAGSVVGKASEGS